MGAVGLFTVQMLIALVAGTAITLGYDSVPDDLTAHTPNIMKGAFFVVGVFAGAFGRKSRVGRGSRFVLLLVIGILQASYLTWLYSHVLSSFELVYGMSLSRYLPLSWAGSQVLGSLVLGMTRKPRRQLTAAEYKPTDKEVEAFIKEHGLFVSARELEELAAKPRGLICSICKIAYTGEEKAEPQWKERWVRCPRVEEHVFHVRDFERAEWRCPVDKTLLYRPKAG